MRLVLRPSGTERAACGHQRIPGRLPRAPRSLLVWTGALALLVVISSVAGLVDPDVYEQETQNWVLQARGQDVGNLLAVVVLVTAVVGYVRGSVLSGLVWLGTLLYLVYAFVVYAMAVHFNALFLLYVAVLGLSAWGVLLHVGDLHRAATQHAGGRARTGPAWTLIAIGAVFAALWLGELIPATLSGEAPASVVEAGLWVNPIHVIDLSMVLPAFVLTGVAALRGRATGLFWLAPWLVFSVLMGFSIVAAMVLMLVAGEADAVVPAVLVSVVVVASLAAAHAHLRGAPVPDRLTVARGATVTLECLVAAGALGGGAAMIADPTGAMGLQPEMLDRLPVDTWLLPGVALIACNGLLPVVTLLAELRGRGWPHRYGHALAGAVLLAWPVTETVLFGYPLQDEPVWLRPAVAVAGVALLCAGLFLRRTARPSCRGRPLPTSRRSIRRTGVVA